MEIKNKPTVTREKGEGDHGGKKGKDHSGTCMKDPQTKPKGGRIEGGRWGQEGSSDRKMETTVYEQQ